MHAGRKLLHARSCHLPPGTDSQGPGPTFLVDSSQVACAACRSDPGMGTSASGLSMRISRHACTPHATCSQGQKQDACVKSGREHPASC